MKLDLPERITNYLSNGGLFNPEMMEHDKVRDLLIDCREALMPRDSIKTTTIAGTNPEDMIQWL